jgi:hypothetical protein
MLRCPNTFFSCVELVRQAQGLEMSNRDATFYIPTYTSRIRGKLRGLGVPDLLERKWRLGYRVTQPVEEIS